MWLCCSFAEVEHEAQWNSFTLQYVWLCLGTRWRHSCLPEPCKWGKIKTNIESTQHIIWEEWCLESSTVIWWLCFPQPQWSGCLKCLNLFKSWPLHSAFDKQSFWMLLCLIFSNMYYSIYKQLKRDALVQNTPFSDAVRLIVKCVHVLSHLDWLNMMLLLLHLKLRWMVIKASGQAHHIPFMLSLQIFVYLFSCTCT